MDTWRNIGATCKSIMILSTQQTFEFNFVKIMLNIRGCYFLFKLRGNAVDLQECPLPPV